MRRFRINRARCRVVATLILLASFTGCQTPDLQPFAAASTEVAGSIAQGGELALQAIAREPLLVNGELVAPGADHHPVRALAAEWTRRREAADAIVAYTGSLAAIAGAAANRRANAAALFESVQQLAAAVPGVSLGPSTAGNLLVTAASGIVEIKAWRDMADAVKNADAAVAVIAEVIRKDLESMSALAVGHHQNQLLLAQTDAEFRRLNRLRTQLREQQHAKRTAVAEDPANSSAGAELVQVDALLAAVERDLDAHLSAIARHRNAASDTQRFYAAAVAGVATWAAAHHDLATAFAERRTPNIALLGLRARELHEQLQQLRQALRQPTPP